MVRVQPLPEPADYEGYAFAYFAGESTDDGEKIYLGASKGNDPLDYDELNDGQPVLASVSGEGSARPVHHPLHEGDRFYLLATDLKAYPAVDFGEAQESGSKYIEVWESTDLVHWSDQRHVKVSSDFAGNTWAPESFYDEAAGEYVVYWASALYPTTDTSGRDIDTSYQRMMYATTRDFVTFSEPQPWIDVKRGTGRGMIDATVVQDGDTFYRVVKDEARMTPRQERSTDLRATVTGACRPRPPRRAGSWSRNASASASRTRGVARSPTARARRSSGTTRKPTAGTSSSTSRAITAGRATSRSDRRHRLGQLDVGSGRTCPAARDTARCCR